MSSSASPSARFWQRLPCLSLMCLILGKVTPSLQCCPAGTSVLLCNGTCQGARSSFWTCFHPSPIFPWVTPHEHRRLLAAAPTPSLVRDAAHGVGRDGKGRDGMGRDGTGRHPPGSATFSARVGLLGRRVLPKGHLTRSGSARQLQELLITRSTQMAHRWTASPSRHAAAPCAVP